MATSTSSPELSSEATFNVAIKNDGFKSATKAPAWKDLFAFTKSQHIGVFIAALVAATAAAVLRTALSIILGRIFDIITGLASDNGSGTRSLTAVSTWCYVLVGLGCVSWIANTMFLASWVAFGEMQANSARKLVVTGFITKDVEWFESISDGLAGVCTRVQTQIHELQSATSQVFGFLVCDAIATCASLAVAFYHSWKLTLVLLSTVPVSFVIISFATRNLESAIASQKCSLQRSSTVVAAAIKGIDLVKIHGGHGLEELKYARAIKSAATHYLSQAKANSIQLGYISFWAISLFVIGFWYSLVLVQQGTSPGAVVTTFYATLGALQGIEALTPHWLIFSKGKSAGSFLSRISSHRNPDKRRLSSGGDCGLLMPQICLGDVRLANIRFSYQSNLAEAVLKGVSLHFPAGQTTYVVGASGSGKSTLGGLIANLYRPLEGDVFIDGHSSRQLHSKWISKHVTVVQQASTFLHDTIFGNIAIGSAAGVKPFAHEVLAACEFALLQTTIASFPEGPQAVLGPGGYQLSGGQKQKLALARARLRDPSVLMLDEPISSLDQTAQGLMMDAIREWRKGKTTIIITHDLWRINDEEYVYLMQDGLVASHGLMSNIKSDPFFASLQNSAREASSSGRGPSPDPRTIRIGPSSFPGLTTHSVGLTSPPAATYSRFHEENVVVQSRPHHSSYASIRAPRLSWRLSTETDRRRQVQPPEFMDKRLSSGSAVKSRTSLGRSPFATDDPENDVASPARRSRQTILFGTVQQRAANIRTVPQREKISASPENNKHKCKADPSKGPSLIAVLSTVGPQLGTRDRFTFVAAVLICVIGAAATPAFSYCLAELLSVVWGKGDRLDDGKKWALILVGLAVVDGLCTGGGHYLFETIGQAWVDHLRKLAFKKIIEQPKPWFQEDHRTAAVISEYLERNAEETRNIMGRFAPIVIVVSSIMSISITWAMIVCWRLTLVTLAALPALFAAIKGYCVVSSQWEERCKTSSSKTGAALTEILVNIPLMHAFDLKDHFRDKFADEASDTLRIGLRRSICVSPLFGLYQSMALFLTALIFYYGTSLVVHDPSLTVNEVIKVINLLLFSIGTSFELLNGLPQITTAKVAAADLLKHAALPPPSSKAAKATKALYKLPSPLPIKMRNVEFGLGRSTDTKILRGLSLNIHPGTCVAVVGASGSGKSTLMSLLLGLHKPEDNCSQGDADATFTFAGISHTAVDMDHLQSMMAYVPQTPFLFPASVADNISYGLPPMPALLKEEIIVDAARASGIHEFILSLPRGYNTSVGDGGQILSGGQAQRLNVAGALARKPRLLILDEPTSALDVENTSSICATIRQQVAASRHMGIVVVTHNPELMRAADRVIVIQAGTTVEEGTYGKLMAERGALWQLVHGG